MILEAVFLVISNNIISLTILVLGVAITVKISKFIFKGK